MSSVGTSKDHLTPPKSDTQRNADEGIRNAVENEKKLDMKSLFVQKMYGKKEARKVRKLLEHLYEEGIGFVLRNDDRIKVRLTQFMVDDFKLKELKPGTMIQGWIKSIKVGKVEII